VAAARGRQHPAARVAPPQTLMGCSPIVSAAQTLSYTIILTICTLTIHILKSGKNKKYR
jgi:hypothetical protein